MTMSAWDSVCPRVSHEFCTKDFGDLDNKMYLMKVTHYYKTILSLLEVAMIQTLPT